MRQELSQSLLDWLYYLLAYESLVLAIHKSQAKICETLSSLSNIVGLCCNRNQSGDMLQGIVKSAFYLLVHVYVCVCVCVCVRESMCLPEDLCSVPRH